MTEGEPKREPSNETGPNLKQKITEAILAGDLEQLIQAIEGINIYLIGSLTNNDVNQIRGQSDVLEKFLNSFKSSNGEYAVAHIYLGDGGISRLVIRANNQEIIIGISDRISTKEVKEKWERLK